MPTLCRIGSIRICMYIDDHNPPHFHALEGQRAVQMKIVDLTVLAGGLSPVHMRRVLDWAAAHPDLLAAEWVRLH